MILGRQLDFLEDPPPPSTDEEKQLARVAGAREIAKDLLERRRVAGLTTDDIRFACETRGIFTGSEQGRTLSFLAGMLKGLGAVATTHVKSRHPRTNGREIRLWVHKDYLEPPLRSRA